MKCVSQHDTIKQATIASFFSSLPVCKNTLYLERDSLSPETLGTMWISREANVVYWVRVSKFCGLIWAHSFTDCSSPTVCIQHVSKHTLRKEYLAISYWSLGKVGALGSVWGHAHTLLGSMDVNQQEGLVVSTYFSWLRLMVDFNRFFFLSALALSWTEAV